MNRERMSRRLKRCLALAVIVLVGTLPLWPGHARAENNVAPAIVLRQQASDGPTAPAVKTMQAMADASQSQAQGMNTKTEAK